MNGYFTRYDFFFAFNPNLKHANPSLSCRCVAAWKLRWSSVSPSTIWWNIDHSCGAVWIWDTHTQSYFRNKIYSEAAEDIIGQFLLQPKKQLLMFWQILSLAFFSSLYFVLFFLWLPWRHCLQWSTGGRENNGDRNVSDLTRMDLSDVFTSVMATMPSTLPPNSSLENVNQTSSSSPRSPPLPPHSQVASVFIVLVVSVIILGTVVGNVLVVVAVFTSRALRAPQNLFLVSLASADILVATLVIPFSLANEVRTDSSIRLCSDCHTKSSFWTSRFLRNLNTEKTTHLSTFAISTDASRLNPISKFCSYHTSSLRRELQW